LDRLEWDSLSKFCSVLNGLCRAEPPSYPRFKWRMDERPLRPVLILDDDPDDGFVTRRLLLRGGIKNPIVMVDRGEQARAFLRSANYGAQAPCAVFIDIKLDGETGFDFLAWARGQQALSQTAIYMLSGSDDPADQLRAEKLGATGYIVKHPTSDELARCVQDACN
jgi:CheY-like chemotaxis protein